MGLEDELKAEYEDRKHYATPPPEPPTRKESFLFELHPAAQVATVLVKGFIVVVTILGILGACFHVGPLK